MIDLSNKYFMMIEPDKEGEPSSEPVEDEITDMINFIYEHTTIPNYAYKGFHSTKCGKRSDNKDHILPNGMITNSLCVYYIQYYRPYIPISEINKIILIYDELISEYEKRYRL